MGSQCTETQVRLKLRHLAAPVICNINEGRKFMFEQQSNDTSFVCIIFSSYYSPSSVQKLDFLVLNQMQQREIKFFHVFVSLSTFEKSGGVKYAGELFFAIAN